MRRRTLLKLLGISMIPMKSACASGLIPSAPTCAENDDMSASYHIKNGNSEWMFCAIVKKDGIIRYYVDDVEHSGPIDVHMANVAKFISNQTTGPGYTLNEVAGIFQSGENHESIAGQIDRIRRIQGMSIIGSNTYHN